MRTEKEKLLRAINGYQRRVPITDRGLSLAISPRNHKLIGDLRREEIDPKLSTVQRIYDYIRA